MCENRCGNPERTYKIMFAVKLKISAAIIEIIMIRENQHRQTHLRPVSVFTEENGVSHEHWQGIF